MRIARRFICSLALLVAALAGIAGTWAQQAQEAKGLKSQAELSAFVSQHQEEWAGCKELETAAKARAKGAWQDQRDQLAALLDSRAFLDRDPGSRVGDPQQRAQEILSQPDYRDTGKKKTGNWLEQALERLIKWLADLLSNLFKNQQAPRAGAGALGFLQFAVWALIFGAVGVFLVVAVMNFGWGRNRVKKGGGGLMEEDEPDRSADEWLTRADELEREGKLREAVRCLYLACLVRLDESGVARLIRSETNWEHLARISRSPKKPPGLDFRGPTQEFDHIWYGFRIRGVEDVQRFREVYTSLWRELQAGKQ